MKFNDSDKMYLMEIADLIREINGYVGRADFEAFRIREDIRESVTSLLAQIGATSTQLSEEFKENYGTIDWDVLTSLQYATYDENLELHLHPIWNIVHYDIPKIEDEILDLAAEIESEEDLKDDSLNDEDYEDLKNLQQEMLNQVREDDIKLEDEFLQEEDNEVPDDRVDSSYIDKRFVTADVVKNSSLADNEEETAE